MIMSYRICSVIVPTLTLGKRMRVLVIPVLERGCIIDALACLILLTSPPPPSPLEGIVLNLEPPRLPFSYCFLRYGYVKP